MICSQVGELQWVAGDGVQLQSHRGPRPPTPWSSQPMKGKGKGKEETSRASNCNVRDLDWGVLNVQDARRLEVIADGLPLHDGTQLAVDTAIVSALQCDGTPQQVSANVYGFVFSKPDDGRSELTKSSSHPAASVVWSSLPMSWADAGPRRH